MTGIQAIKTALQATQANVAWYLSDFTDAELLVRPVPGANHAAWQIGNIIGGDVFLVTAEMPNAAFPTFPEGFLELHGPKGTANDGPAGFLTKAEYLKLFDETRTATIAALETLSDADLDRPTSEGMQAWAPTFAHLFLFVSNHTLMHAGQFSVIRRKLGKPVLM